MCRTRVIRCSHASDACATPPNDASRPFLRRRQHRRARAAGKSAVMGSETFVQAWEAGPHRPTRGPRAPHRITAGPTRAHAAPQPSAAWPIHRPSRAASMQLYPTHRQTDNRLLRDSSPTLQLQRLTSEEAPPRRLRPLATNSAPTARGFVSIDKITQRFSWPPQLRNSSVTRNAHREPQRQRTWLPPAYSFSFPPGTFANGKKEGVENDGAPRDGGG